MRAARRARIPSPGTAAQRARLRGRAGAGGGRGRDHLAVAAVRAATRGTARHASAATRIWRCWRSSPSPWVPRCWSAGCSLPQDLAAVHRLRPHRARRAAAAGIPAVMALRARDPNALPAGAVIAAVVFSHRAVPNPPSGLPLPNDFVNVYQGLLYLELRLPVRGQPGPARRGLAHRRRYLGDPGHRPHPRGHLGDGARALLGAGAGAAQRGGRRTAVMHTASVERLIPASPARVWTALSTPAGRAGGHRASPRRRARGAAARGWFQLSTRRRWGWQHAARSPPRTPRGSPRIHLAVGRRGRRHDGDADTLEPAPSGTLVRVEHAGFATAEAAAEHAQGWADRLGRSPGHLASR